MNQITSAGARCDNLVKTFCSRKMSSHVEAVLLIIRETTFRIIVLAVRFDSQLNSRTIRTNPAVLRIDE